MSGNKLKLQGFGQAVGGIAATAMTNAAMKKENERNREYNLKLAQMQNQWNVEQWQRENDYNSPTAQVKRLREAGLNPDMLYGGGISNTSASSPMMTAGSASSPTPLVGMPNSVDSYLDAQLKQAQIDNINADTSKKGAETSILTSDASFRDAINRGLLETTNINIKVANKNMEFTDQQIKQSQKVMQRIDAECQHIGATIQQIQNAIRNDNARLELDKTLNKATIEKIASECDLNYASAENITQQLEKVLREYDDKHDINVSEWIRLNNEHITQDLQQARLRIDNGRAEFEAYLHGPHLFENKYGILEGGFQFTTRIVDTILSNLK